MADTWVTGSRLLPQIKLSKAMLREPHLEHAISRSRLQAHRAGGEGLQDRLYMLAVGRTPEPGVLAGWVHQIEEGRSVVRTILAFFHS